MSKGTCREIVISYKQDKGYFLHLQICISKFLFMNRIFLCSILFSLLYFIVIYTFLIYFTWSRCSLVRSRNNTLDETRDREQTGGRLRTRRDSRYRFYWSSAFYSFLLLVISRRSVSSVRASITERVDVTHARVAHRHDWKRRDDSQKNRARRPFLFYLHT